MGLAVVIVALRLAVAVCNLQGLEWPKVKVFWCVFLAPLHYPLCSGGFAVVGRPSIS